MSKRAVIVVDIQNDYFPGGKNTLAKIEQAASAAADVIKAARAKGDRVFHIQHIFTSHEAPFFTPDSEGSEINPIVAPDAGEPVIVKNFPNPFLKTDLKSRLDEAGIEDVVIVGAMSHMCIDAAARAASDFGYNTSVVQDACATCDQEHEGVTVPAAQVHAVMMAALGFGYASIINAADYIQS